jgi:nitroreductase
MPGPDASSRDVVFSDIDHVLSTTRAVRKRLDLDRAVEPSVIAECLRLAAQAPTGGNIQSWRFVVVTDADRRAAIGEYYRQGAAEYLAAGLARARTDEQRRVAQSSLYLMENIGRVPVHVLACMKGRPPEGQNQAGFYGSIMPAVWSFALALRSRGLGSVWTTLHLAHEREVAQLLDIPDDVTQVALLPVAYTVGLDFKPAARQPIEQFTYWNRYGDTESPS